MGFVRMAYLPEGKVKLAVGDIHIDGIEVIKPYHMANLPEGMRLHGDLSLCYLGEGVAVCAPEAYDYYKDKLPVKLIKGETAVGSNYPYDAAYNVAIVGKRIFCRVDSTDSVLLKAAREMGYGIINIKQGYSKCSVCPVDSMSAVSGDMSFYRAAEKEGLDVLLVTNGGIKLKGFDNGFFGGCAYMESKSVFSAKGDVRLLPDYEKIKAFLDKRNIKIKQNCGEVVDFGSFIPIWEE